MLMRCGCDDVSMSDGCQVHIFCVKERYGNKYMGITNLLLIISCKMTAGDKVSEYAEIMEELKKIGRLLRILTLILLGLSKWNKSFHITKF